MQAVTISTQHIARKIKELGLGFVENNARLKNFADIIDVINDWRVPFIRSCSMVMTGVWSIVMVWKCLDARIPPCPLAKGR